MDEPIYLGSEETRVEIVRGIQSSNLRLQKVTVARLARVFKMSIVHYHY